MRNRNEVWRRMRHAVLLAMVAGAGGACSDPSAPGAGAENGPLGPFSAWAPATSIELAMPGAHATFNTEHLDGCPVTSRDGLRFYIASTRPGGLGGIDIWVSTRASVSAPWGAPVNVGAPINSPDNDFCPMPTPDRDLFYFVSNRAGGCGGTDIYSTRIRQNGTVDAPQNLGCAVNSAADEAGPVPAVETGDRPVLYFSSARAGGFTAEAAGAISGDSDLYVSARTGTAYEAATLVPDVNSAAEDGQPYVRRDARELYFFSTRPGGLGMADIYVATRTSASGPWSVPQNLGANINSAAAETRPSLSWNGATLYFGSTRPGGEGNNDVHVSTRSPASGGA